MNTINTGAQLRAKGRDIFRASHADKAQELVIAVGQRMGMGIPNHLQTMFQITMRRVILCQLAGLFLRNPTGICQPRQSGHGLTYPQGFIPPARDQLAGLGEKLNLSDAAGRKLQIPPFQAIRPRLFRFMQALVIPDSLAHVVGVFDGCKIEMAAPDKGAHPRQKRLPRCDITGTGTRLDIGRPFPCPPHPFVVALSRLHRHADRRDRRIRTQAQIRAEDIALCRAIIEDAHHLARGLDKAGAGLHCVGGIWIAGLVEQADQVDVAGIIQFMGAHLSHGENHHARPGCAILRPHTRDFAIGEQGQKRRIQCRLHGEIRKLRERRRYLHHVPCATQIRQGRHEREPPLRLAQHRIRPIQPSRLRLCNQVGNKRVQRLLQRGAQPGLLRSHQTTQIGAAARHTGQKRPQFGRQILKGCGRIACSVRIMGQRAGGQARAQQVSHGLVSPAKGGSATAKLRGWTLARSQSIVIEK